MNRSTVWMFMVALASVGACESDANTPSEIVSRASIPDADVMHGVHHVMTKAGVRSAVLDGDSAIMRDEGKRLDVVGVRMKFFAENGAETGTLTSRTGEYIAMSGVFIARGNVVLVTQGPKGQRKVETEELSFDVKSDQIRSEKPFVLTEGGTVTRGSSFQTDSKSTSWTVQGMQTQGAVERGPSQGTF